MNTVYLAIKPRNVTPAMWVHKYLETCFTEDMQIVQKQMNISGVTKSIVYYSEAV